MHCSTERPEPGCSKSREGLLSIRDQGEAWGLLDLLRKLHLASLALNSTTLASLYFENITTKAWSCHDVTMS